MKILTVLGTRPEIIRLSRIIPKLDDVCDNKIFHTGQNYDPKLNDIFFEELGLRKPDFQINSKADSFGEQLANILIGAESVLKSFNPDKVLILGDTNSSLTAIMAERMGYPVYHMEAGNRCFDLKVPEEVNRKMIDAVSSFNIPYTNSSRENLINDGVNRTRIFVSGNPINEVMTHYMDQIDSSNVLKRLFIEKQKYILVTAHRAENVDLGYRLTHIFEALSKIGEKYKMPVIFSCHPRTKKKYDEFKIYTESPYVKIYEPFGFFDFVNLEKNAFCVITDSGTVQEECCLLRVPTVTIRDTTERPETVECGSNMVSGLNTLDIVSCFDIMSRPNRSWNFPEGYDVTDVSEKIVKLITGINKISQ
jgi:UDP-N-acetylglucosamine 2-epimerase (non-hydrolysing)